MNAWPPQPGLTVMQSTRSTDSAQLGDRLDRRARVDRQAGEAAGVADLLQRVVDVRRRLELDRDRVGARLDELLDLALGPLDHQVAVEQAAGVVHLVADRLDDHRPDRDRRDEVAVHDVDVDRARAGVEHRRELLAEARVVGRQDRRLHLRRDQLASSRFLRALIYTGFSIEPPHRTQVRFAVSLIRTIVECSPQLGQWDMSWKRTRQ